MRVGRKVKAKMKRRERGRQRRSQRQRWERARDELSVCCLLCLFLLLLCLASMLNSEMLWVLLQILITVLLGNMRFATANGVIRKTAAECSSCSLLLCGVCCCVGCVVLDVWLTQWRGWGGGLHEQHYPRLRERNTCIHIHAFTHAKPHSNTRNTAHACDFE